MNYKGSKKAFTLYELVISIALFLLVAALVIAFITFMENFDKTNQKNADRAKQLNVARQELDYWFSYFDSDDFELTFNLADSVCAKATNKTTGENYFVQLQLVPDEDGEFERKLVFVYPLQGFAHGEEAQIFQDGAWRSVRRVQLDAAHVSRIRIVDYTPPATHISESKEFLRFVVELPVSQRTFACDLFYAE